jgi:hypothetical protein
MKIGHGAMGHGHPGPTKRVHRPPMKARGLGEIGGERKPRRGERNE